jgi:hypothetical protein
MPLIFSQIDGDNYNMSMGYITSNSHGEKFIITTLHTCNYGDDPKIFAQIDDNDEEAYIYIKIYEIDIAVLKLINKLITTPDAVISSELQFDNGSIRSNTDIYYTKTVEIKMEYIKSELLPKIPVYSISAECDSTESHSLLAGSEVIKNDKLYGFVIKKNNNEITAVPCLIINMFLLHIFDNPLSELKGIIVYSCYCEVIDKKKIIGNYITENTCFYPSTNSMDIMTKFSFRQNDILLSIDDKEFNSDMSLYFDDLSCFLPINTYFMFALLQKNNVKIKLLRNNTVKTIYLNGISYNNIFKIRIYGKKYINWNGFIFCELTEEILVNNFSQKKYNIFSIDGSKYVALINWKSTLLPEQLLFFIKTDGLSESYLTQLSERKLLQEKPLLKVNVQKLYLVDKIGNKFIKSLDDISGIILGDKRKVSFKNVEANLFIEKIYI